MNEITAYLQNPIGGYKRGLALLKTVHANRADIQALEPYAERQFAPIWAQDKLNVLLRGHVTATMSVPQNSKPTTQNSFPPPSVNFQQKPPVVKALLVEEKELRDKRRELHDKLEDSSQQLQKEMVKEIRQYTTQIDNCWTKIHNYENDGTIPPIAENTEGGQLSREKMKNDLLIARQRKCKLEKILLDDELTQTLRERYTKQLDEKKELITKYETALYPNRKKKDER